MLARFDGGFLLVRQSGTSPAIRLTCEHKDTATAKKLLKATRERLARDGIKDAHA
jgi:phosphomannomutase